MLKTQKKMNLLFVPHKLIFIIVYLVTFLVSNFAFSEKITKNRSIFGKNKKSDIEFGVSGSYENFIQHSDIIDVKNPYIVNISLNTKKLKYRDYDLELEIEPNISNQPYLRIQNAYERFRLTKYLRLSFGFYDRIWNELDHKWGLGLWQSQVRRDYLNPKQTGLVGGHLDIGSRWHQLSFFVSGVYLPDQGPQFKEEEGQVTSYNPWFSEPQNELDLNGVSTPILYKIHRPEISDVIFQPSFALRYKIWFEKTYWANLAISQKPMNQLSLVMDYKLKSLSALASANVNVYPEVVKHNVLSFDLGLKARRTKTWLSYNYDKPIYDEIDPSEFVRSSMVEAQFFGGFIEHRISRFLMRGGFLLNQQNILNESKDSVIENIESALSRFDYDEFVTLGAERVGGPNKWGYGFDYYYSVKNQGGILKSFVNYNLFSHLTLRFDLKIIGSEEENNSFFDKYRSNDSAVFGVKYVF